MSQLKASLGILLLLTAGNTVAGDEAVLRYKLGKDDKQVYRTVTTMKQTQTVANTDIETEIENTSIAERTLDKIDDKGNFRVRTEEKQLKVRMKIGPVGEYNYDSATGKLDEGTVLSAALNPVFDKLKNAISVTVVTPRGEVLAVEGLEGILEAAGNDPIAKQLMSNMTSEGLKLAHSELYPQFEEKAVKPGDTWESKYELALPKLGKAAGKRIYTYEGADKVGDRKTARIRVTHELAFDLDIDDGTTKAKGKLRIDQSSGVIQFDPEKGELLSMDNSYVIGGDLSIDVGGKLLPLKSTQTQTVKMERLDKLPEK